MLPDPDTLFMECLQNPEPLIDGRYCYDELIISKGLHYNPTAIMKVHAAATERICAAKTAKNDGMPELYKKHIQVLDKILMESENAQFLELTSFFPVMDVSFSKYKKLDSTDRFGFLKTLLEYYLDKRHGVYMSHGYSATTLQVRKDFSKHKRLGGAANRKIKNIFEGLGYKPVHANQEISRAGRQKYCFIDQRQGKASLIELAKQGKLRHYQKWSKKHGGKRADVLFSGSKGQYFICEAKHIKESGGGQDKQMNELIAFIDDRDDAQRSGNIFYTAFLDGVYFNRLSEPSPPVKIKIQKESIKKSLQSRKKRFFVNTYGFKKLLAHLRSP